MKNSPVHWLCLGLMLLLAQPAASQDVVGTTTIQNRSVELLSDKTWRYKDSQTAGLDEILKQSQIMLSFAIRLIGKLARPRVMSLPCTL